MKIKEYNKISDVIAEEIFSLEEAIFDNPYTRYKRGKRGKRGKVNYSTIELNTV